ncbi:glycosyltransferase [Lactobacillus selangorensis]|uniref:Glycosyltransferase n=1 Tax=Lactobacillus selangorensis TaxID=81857 RepID=A0A0R2FX24_9LACO|nr:glycosyltransferase [Lactobacillus selangorensis]
MQANKSGIEHAEIKRLRLFNHHNTDVRMIFRDWNPSLHIATAAAGIEDRQVLNMFDYFQDTLAMPQQALHVDDISFGVPHVRYEDDAAQNRYLVTAQNGQLVARVNYRGADRQVWSTELFDGYNNLYRVDNYDARGFKTLVQYYTPDNKVGTEAWLDRQGQVVLETFHKYDMQQEWQQAGWRLRDRRDGKTYQFDTIEHLTLHFLDDVNAEFWSNERPNVFILDRAHIADWGFLHLKKPAYTAFHLHNSQAGNAQEPLHSILNNNYEFSMNAIDGYDCVISATQRQTNDVEARFHPHTKLFTIPVGIVPDSLLNAPRIPVKDRQFGKMVVFARVAWEKHLDDLCRAIAIVKKAVPEVSLDIYGYADSSDNYRARRAVEAVIKENQLEDTVTLKGYTTNIDEIENQAMMYGLTSRMEGFNLAIMEAISHGLISFSYDVNYGPNEIVQDGVNGNVVPYEDYQEMARDIIKVLKNPQLAQKYSTGAYDSSERYSEANVWQDWTNLLADAKRVWPAKLAAAGLEA